MSESSSPMAILRGFNKYEGAWINWNGIDNNLGSMIIVTVPRSIPFKARYVIESFSIGDVKNVGVR
jgi:hypothetical protein